MRLIRGLILVLFFGLPAYAQRPQDLLSLEGMWAGSYTCGTGHTPLNLRIGQNISYPGGMSATFTFGRQTRDGTMASGEFYMKVTRLGFNDFKFEPTQWVYQPDNTEWFSLRGHMENGTIAGTIDHPACSTFTVYPAAE